jgi:hypothetical protein
MWHQSLAWRIEGLQRPRVRWCTFQGAHAAHFLPLVEGPMASRSVTDSAGRVWACRQDDIQHYTTQKNPQADVSILCTTETLHIPVRITVGWQWRTLEEASLAGQITEASPAPGKR